MTGRWLRRGRARCWRSTQTTRGFLQMAVANGVAQEVPAVAGVTSEVAATSEVTPATAARSVIEAAAIVEAAEASGAPVEDPESFAGGRYRVLRFLGEGGKKPVFLAHDALLDRDVAFSLIKTEGLDDEGRQRMGRPRRRVRDAPRAPLR